MGLFSGKTPHPLADEAERASALAAIAAAPSLEALQRVTDLLRSVAPRVTLPLAQREVIIRQLDDVAHGHARVLGREFLTMAHLSPDEELTLWRTNRDFWAQLGASYYGCVTESYPAGTDDAVRRLELARLTVRMLRAYSARLKWDQFRYWPASEAIWQIMGRGYLFAFDNGFARREVSAYHGERHPSTVELEYLKAVVFQVSATDSLLPFEIEIAERLVAFFAGKFSLSEAPGEGFTYCVDPAERRAPARVGEQSRPAATLRFVNTSDALPALEELRAALEAGEVPAHLDIARYRSPRIILPVVRHLASHWGAEPPKREHNRYRVRSGMAVVLGLPAVFRAVSDVESPPAPLLTWTVDNVSQGGLRARLPLAGEQSPPHIGTLLGMKPAGGDNWLVGVVRRFARESGDIASAGVQTLSKHPVPIETQSGETSVRALLLDAPDEGEAVRVVAPSMVFRGSDPVTFTLAGRALRLMPLELQEQGAEFDLVRFRVEQA